MIAITVFLAVFTGIWLVTMRLQPESEVEAYKKSLRAKGERLEISEVLPPPVAPESNGAAAAQSAFAMIGALSDEWTNLPPMMRMVAPGRAMVGWAQPDVRGSDFTNSWENVMAAAEASRPGRERLQQAMGYPTLDFQLDYNKGPEILLPHLAPLKRSAQRLSAAAMCDLHRSEAASATTNLCTLLALVQSTHDERLLISQLVRMAMTQIALAANWELLQSTNLTEGQLAALQNSWERLEFTGASENSMLMERAVNETTINKMRSSSIVFNRWFGYGSGGSSSPGGSGDWFEDMENWAKYGWDNIKFAGAKFMWQTSWSYSDELRALQCDQVILESLRTIRTNQVFLPAFTNMTAQLDTMGITNASEGWLGVLDVADFRSFFSGAQSGLSAVVRKTMAVEVSRRIIVTAIALKRCQLKHGNYPAELSGLTPEFLPTVPLDPVDGKPLRYRPNSDGTFLLYSIGEDGVDDGGDTAPPGALTNPGWFWQKGRDWVWPQPASPEEVQKYYDEQASKSK